MNLFFMCCNTANSANAASLYPAIIAGIAAIAGIMVGFLGNALLRHWDNKDKWRQKQIESFEGYYQPLAKELYVFLLCIKKLKKKRLTLSQNPRPPLTYSLFVRTDLSELSFEIGEFKAEMGKVIEMLSGSSYRHSGNFKIEFFRNKVLELLTGLNKTIKDKDQDNRVISFEIVEKLLEQVENMLNSTNCIHRCYLSAWRYCKTKKYNNQ